MSFSIPSAFTTDETTELAYIDGLTASGAIAAASYWMANGETAHKWQNGGGGGGAATVGVGGGTVTYSFHSGDFTAAQQTMIEAALTLWSDIANIKFVLATSGAANVTFKGSTTDGASESDHYSNVFNELARTTSATVTLNTSADGGYGDISSFTAYGGYGVSTVIHEIGHLMGLGHAGDYNGSVNSATQQYSAYDNRLYSVMSYIDTTDTSAKYYSAGGAAASAVWSGESSYTPQILDILAVQQLYGASTSSAFSGGQVFGFHCNISDASKIFYDFTVDAAPIVTLFDYGSNNTLDLSGYGMACTVNLNPGAFSSVGGYVNNLGIAYGTSIDSAIGGGGNDIFYVNSEADVIDGGAGANKVIFSGAYSAYTISYGPGNVVVTATATGIADTLINIQSAQFSDAAISLCFVAGTGIATPRGDIAVENLRRGDLVLTADGAARPVAWLGRMTVASHFVDPLRHFPIRIAAGALGENNPRRDLLVSPAHALLVDTLLVEAGALVNGTSIRRETAPPEVFGYYHVELDDHALILAEGAPAETFIDNADRMNFDNWAEHQALYPEGKPVGELSYPRVKARRQLPARLRAALEARARALGFEICDAA